MARRNIGFKTASLSSDAEQIAVPVGTHDVAVGVDFDETNETDPGDSICLSPSFVDKGCQANIISYSSASASESSVIVKYIKIDSSTCDAEIQTDIFIHHVPKIVCKRSVKCGTRDGTENGAGGVKMTDQKVGPDLEREKLDACCHERSFSGFSSIKTNENMLDLAGVSINTFNFLLDSFKNSDKWKIKKEDRL